MLSIQQKSNILMKAGQAVPAPPADASVVARDGWARSVENLYVAYVAARAARSLREAEEVRQLDRLRRMASGAYA